MQRNTGYFPTESLEPSGNRLFSRSALNEGYLFRGSLGIAQVTPNRTAPGIFPCAQSTCTRRGVISHFFAASFAVI